ncbi:carboxymuconolactone decarboxylase family protein [Micromonospora soli]|uniref:carboxymuconolactone decarboxylase family protein n=1 Tax=Micromonospora sp. NBRC 110009 TaxID=3061627 RepID=UPI002671B4C7|nr:carboxymuconolactone decarboxylase family protein [Micromonospora sp. NBRC 110009]WKT99697.1 carboxymuconolactone decarboxylase family protein [Micromonospora sp. NBRC 110009]
MGLDAVKAALPEYAKDIKLNLGSTVSTSTLPPGQAWGTALACAVAARNPVVLREIVAEAADHLTPEAIEAAKGAATIMAMNNVYYRAKHLIGDEQYASMPARLRMQIIARPGVDKGDFELWCLAVSAITGCGVCLESHEKTLRAAGFTREQVHEGLRIAAVVHAAAVALDAEAALA